jgi:hypothetical protein
MTDKSMQVVIGLKQVMKRETTHRITAPYLVSVGSRTEESGGQSSDWARRSSRRGWSHLAPGFGS